MREFVRQRESEGSPRVLSELDLALVNALQINPRAPWSEIARALDVDAATAARRWERLQAAGNAWVTGYGFAETATGALIEVDCAPGQDTTVADTVAADPHTVTVEHAAGGRDLLITVMVSDFGALSAYIVDRLGSIPGVTSTRAHLMTRNYAEGSVWRLRSLTRSQQELLVASRRAAKGGQFDPLEQHRELLHALGENGRVSMSDLATRLGVSISTVSRRLNRLVAAGSLVFRCDLARSLSGAPVTVTFFGSTPPDLLDATARELAKIPEIRMCIGVAGPRNLIATAWVGSLMDVQSLEIRLVKSLPHFHIADRAVSLRTVKLMGRRLDPEGRAVGFVAVDPWARMAAPERATPA
ncbi:Lrp/AsnC family transcriptional regulator [Streptomyces sp. NPDC056352]|uniref:Lrp/AsnC family transcriptional regulator n=1 Tax=Streptomyces sp. NPDC056352 TaxID=3345791 RepID=UPI0035D79DFE